jgi:hypothetical protein
MPDIVNDDDLSALAAEYVLGTLEPDERTRANVLLDVDHGFRGLVRVWERRLGELHLMVEPVEPDGKIWERLKGKLGTVVPTAAPAPTIVPREPVAPPPAPPKEQPKEQAKEASKEQAKEPSREPPKEESKASTPEQKLAELIMEVEKFHETRPPEPPVPADSEPSASEAAVAPPVVPDETPERLPERVTREPPKLLVAEERAARPRERGRGWMAYGLLMTLVAFGLGGLIAAWRFIPDLLPPKLQPIAFLKLVDIGAPPAKKPPPDSEFDE